MFSAIILLLLLFCNSVCCRPEPQIALRRHSNGTLSINGSFQLDELCSQLPDGTYPDYTQACRMFFICSRGKKVATFWCTKGFVFSLTSGHCEPPDRAMCPDYQNPSVLDEVISFHVDDEECSQGDGVYPNFAESCSSFHVCRVLENLNITACKLEAHWPNGNVSLFYSTGPGLKPWAGQGRLSQSFTPSMSRQMGNKLAWGLNTGRFMADCPPEGNISFCISEPQARNLSWAQ
ncbi:uncharacterized protein TNCV_3511331 [Trichonephila clavipes]|nr:uncharacterized protein TNCV_3511331 [Trichonephila clavipes]